jgi:hypothetical protein
VKPLQRRRTNETATGIQIHAGQRFAVIAR